GVPGGWWHRIGDAARLVAPDAAAAQAIDAPRRGHRRHPHAEHTALDRCLDLGEVDGLQGDADDPGRQALRRPEVLPLGPAVDVIFKMPRDFQPSAGRATLEE